MGSSDIIELSWIAKGVASRMPSAPRKGRAQIILAPVIGVERERRGGSRGPASQALQPLERRRDEDQAADERRRPDCRAGRAPASRPAGRTSAACPAASRSPEIERRAPTSPSAPADEIVIADRGAAGGHQQVGAARAPAAMALQRSASSSARCRAATIAAGRPRAARPAPSRWRLTIWSGPIGSPGSTSSSPVGRMATRGRRWTSSQRPVHRRGEPTSRAVRRRPAARQRSRRRRNRCRAGRTLPPTGAPSRHDHRVAVARRRPPG